MSAKGENSTCLYKDGEMKIFTINSMEETAAKEDGWADSPGGSPSVTVKAVETPLTDVQAKEEISTKEEGPTKEPAAPEESPEVQTETE